jgi:predicted nucleic acid-binding protein
MTAYYLDTSALIKHYHVEIGTPVVNQILSKPCAIHFLSRLAGVEMQSALAKKVRMMVLTESDFKRFRRKFLSDITSAHYRVVRLLVRHFQIAEQLLLRYGLTRSLRTLDAIQLAVAIDVRRRHGIDYFVCADTNLCKIAADEGFTVINPTTYAP